MKTPKIFSLLAAALLFAAVLASPAPAAEREDFRLAFLDEEDAGGPPPRMRGEGGPDAAEMRETLRLWRFHKLRQELNLSEQQSDAVLKADERKERRERELMERGREAMEALRGALDAKASDAELQKRMDALEALRLERQKIEDQHLRDLRSALSVEQQARYVLFEKESRERMRQMLMQRRERREGTEGAPMPPRRPGMR
jgi:hypothetical protein